MKHDRPVSAMLGELRANAAQWEGPWKRLHWGPGGGWSWEAQGQRCQTHDKEAMGKMAGAIPEQRTQLPWTISM